MAVEIAIGAFGLAKGPMDVETQSPRFANPQPKHPATNLPHRITAVTDPVLFPAVHLGDRSGRTRPARTSDHSRTPRSPRIGQTRSDRASTPSKHLVMSVRPGQHQCTSRTVPCARLRRTLALFKFVMRPGHRHAEIAARCRFPPNRRYRPPARHPAHQWSMPLSSERAGRPVACAAACALIRALPTNVVFGLFRFRQTSSLFGAHHRHAKRLEQMKPSPRACP